MILNKTFNDNIKIKDLAYINDLGCEIIEYYPNDNTLMGRVYVTGSYHSSKTDEVKLVSEDVEFLFELEMKDFYVEDIECVNFDYSVIEGIGINVIFEVKLNVNMEEEKSEIIIDNRGEFKNNNNEDNNEDNNEEISENHNEEILDNFEEEIELYKNEINKDVDKKLSEKLEIVNDNLPQNEVIFRELKDENTLIKIVYFNNEKELNEIAKNNNVTLESIFKSNKKTDFNNKKRVIIKYGK